VNPIKVYVPLGVLTAGTCRKREDERADSEITLQKPKILSHFVLVNSAFHPLNFLPTAYTEPQKPAGIARRSIQRSCFQRLAWCPQQDQIPHLLGAAPCTGKADVTRSLPEVSSPRLLAGHTQLNQLDRVLSGTVPDGHASRAFSLTLCDLGGNLDKPR
jgi:hypothetical protein